MSRFERKVHWWPTGDSSRPWAVWVGEEHWELVVTDTQGQRRYALLINGHKEEEFVDWPPTWTTEPEDSPGLNGQRAEYEYEMEKFEKNKHMLPIEEDELDG